MTKIYIGGVSGCGKSIVAQMMKDKYPTINYLAGSEIMMKAAGLSSREELDKLPEEIKNRLRVTAFQSYYSQECDIIAEGHYNLTDADIKLFEVFILIEATPQFLLNLRKSDKSRKRPITIDAIQNEIDQMRRRIQECRNKYKIKIIQVDNMGSLHDLFVQIERIFNIPKPK